MRFIKNHKGKSLILACIGLSLLACIGLSLYYLFRTGFFLQVEGDLLIPANEKGVSGIYRVSLREDRKELYFKSLDYEARLKAQYGELYASYNYPVIQGDQFFCVGFFMEDRLRRDEDKISVLFMGDAKNPMKNEAQVITQAPGYIRYPVRTRNGETFYYIYYHKDAEGGKQGWGIYQYEVQSRQETLLRKRINEMAPLFLTDEGEIIYSGYVYRKDTKEKKHKRESYTSLFKLCLGKEDELLVENAEYPTWYEAGKSLLFYDFEEEASYIYDLATKEKVRFGNAQQWEGPPLVFPDKKHLVTVESGIHYFVMARHYIATQDGKEKRELTSIPVETFYSKSAMCWLE